MDKINNLDDLEKLTEAELKSKLDNNTALREKLNVYYFGLNNGPQEDVDNKVVFDEVEGTETPVLKGLHNTWIVFGRDRPGERDGFKPDDKQKNTKTIKDKMGYGAKGHIRAGAIDIVVGRYGNISSKELNGVPQGNNFVTDSARIYISQKADIDTYFSLAPGATGMSNSKSAIAIKADDIRLISRNTFKIVTGVDNETRDGKSKSNRAGIQIIANNDSSDLQPMVKGNNLVEALREITKAIAKLNSYTTEYVKIQSQFNSAVASHVHLSPFFGEQCSPSPQVTVQTIPYEMSTFTKIYRSMYSQNSMIQNIDTVYLSGVNKKYINSNYNSVN